MKGVGLILIAKNVLIFPAIYTGQAELLYSLKAMDLSRVLMILDPHFVEEYQPTGNYLCDDFQFPERTAAHVLEWREKHGVAFTGIVGTDEEMQFQFTRQLAAQLGLEFYSPITCAIASNKYLMKRAFAENGIPSSPFVLLSDLDPQQINQVGFPNILKMVNGTASEYTFLNRDMGDLQRNFALLKNAVANLDDSRLRETVVTRNGIAEHFNPRQQFILDGFIKGEEYSADFRVCAGEISLIRIVKKINHPLFGYFRGYHLLSQSSAAVQGLDPEQLSQVCRNLSRSLQIDKGVCMVDFMLDGDVLNVIEASIRPGFSAFVPLMQKVCGYTSVSILVELNLGHVPKISLPDKDGLVVQLFASREGKLKVFDTSRIEQRAETFEVFKYVQPGDRVTNGLFSHYGLLLGFALLDPGKTDVIALADQVENETEIVIEDE